MALTQFQFTGADWENPDPADGRYFECINEAIKNRIEFANQFAIITPPFLIPLSENPGLYVQQDSVSTWISKLKQLCTWYDKTVEDGFSFLGWTGVKAIDLDPRTPRYQNMDDSWHDATFGGYGGYYINDGTTNTVYIFSNNFSSQGREWAVTTNKWTWETLITAAGITADELAAMYFPLFVSDPKMITLIKSCYKILNKLVYIWPADLLQLQISALGYKQEHRRCKQETSPPAITDCEGVTPKGDCGKVCDTPGDGWYECIGTWSEFVLTSDECVYWDNDLFQLVVVPCDDPRFDGAEWEFFQDYIDIMSGELPLKKVWTRMWRCTIDGIEYDHVIYEESSCSSAWEHVDPNPNNAYISYFVGDYSESQSYWIDCMMNVTLTYTRSSDPYNHIEIIVPVELQTNDGSGSAWTPSMRSHGTFNTNENTEATLGAQSLPAAPLATDRIDFYSVAKIVFNQGMILTGKVDKFNDSI